MMYGLHDIHTIKPHLYLSGAKPVTAERIKALGITSVINVSRDLPRIKVRNVRYMQIDVEDHPGQNLEPYFEQCNNQIEYDRCSNGKTLVHCLAGISRSVSLVLAYLMKHDGMTLEDAYNFVKMRRPCVGPNIGFWQQLIDYEKKLFGKNTIRSVAGKIQTVKEVETKKPKNYLFSKSNWPMYTSDYPLGKSGYHFSVDSTYGNTEAKDKDHLYASKRRPVLGYGKYDVIYLNSKKYDDPLFVKRSPYLSTVELDDLDYDDNYRMYLRRSPLSYYSPAYEKKSSLLTYSAYNDPFHLKTYPYITSREIYSDPLYARHDPILYGSKSYYRNEPALGSYYSRYPTYRYGSYHY